MDYFASAYPYIKSFHIVFVVSWFVGLFYMVRLFIYHVEAYEKPEPDRRILTTEYKRIQQLLWKIIMNTAAVLTIIMGVLMLLIRQDLIFRPWMQVKLALVLGLLVYHWKCGQMMRELEQDIVKWTSGQLRLWNELTTIFLLAIVLLVVLQNAFDWIWGIGGIILFGVILMMLVKLAKRLRNNR